ncbi:hypothetical protein GQX73_g2534 [Xylaria multiplex]|uniref:F-box domain-containing protein n=1 Tax=Xylaria multiplex TaxID=323545 RepID=A0A7C8MTA2_9PEZI|nr:hypothetical protein GQX73_g2534 [Xylaria multiplex]
MNAYSLRPKQRGFDNSEAWRGVREHHHQIIEAASRLEAIRIRTLASPEESSSHAHSLSALQRLPEEVLVTIMGYLDYESLYRLSQTSSGFLRLSFDSVFESDPSWRTFRHAIDGLSNGPRRRVLGKAKCPPRTPVMAQELLPPQPKPESNSESGSAQKYAEESGATSEGETIVEFMARERLALQHTERGSESILAQQSGATFNIEDEYEGETMVEFMARGHR